MARNFDLINEESSLLKRKKFIIFFEKIYFPAPHFPSIIVHGSRRLSMNLSANTAVNCEGITVWEQIVAGSTTEHCSCDVTN